MFMLIATLIPSILGVKVIESQIGGENISKKRYFYFFLLLLLVSSIINNIVAYVLFNIDIAVLEYLNTLPIFFAKYTLFSVFINLLIAFIIVVILKNVSLEVRVIKNEKETKAKKKKNK